MAVWTPDETERLIKLVRQNHTLYDSTSNEYRNRDVLKTLWSNIANEMNQSGRLFLNDMDCRDRWNSLRDGYRRFMKDDQVKNSLKPKKRKTWQWSEDMSFLKPYMQERTPSSVVASAESACNQNNNQHSQNLKNNVCKSVVSNICGGENSRKDLIGTELSDTLSDDASANCIVHIVTDNTDTNRVPRKEASDGVICVDYVQKKNLQHQSNTSYLMNKKHGSTSFSVESTASNEISVSPVTTHNPVSSLEDSDEQFFQSLLPDVKSLSPKKKGHFKIQVQQLLQEMLYPKKNFLHQKSSMEF